MPLLSFLFWFHCCMSLTHSASSQTVSKEGERIKMFLTPTICKVRCSAGRCTNYCEHGNVTTLYSNEPIGQPPSETGFRIFLCPMLCQNGGVCIQKDRCQCPQNFTGKFCHIPATSSTNDIEKSQLNPSVLRDQQLMSQSEYLLPLQSEEHHQTNAESSMVKVRVQHPPEASIKIHQVLKVGTGETGRAQQDTVTRTTRVLEARNSLPGEKAEALSPQVQAQDFLGDSADTESSVFKYCFREFRNGQCSSRLPGLRTPKTCCEGTGIAWGINECILCPSHGNGTDGDKQCPKGYERINDTQCVDINECLQPGRCQNGNCINTRGSYSCVCRQGFLLDASHRICVSEKVISEDKGQCYRLLSSGVCSLPILRNITKQICCCSRVGKAWGRNCEKCPYFGSDAFKETCPAGPGYHYSPFAHQPNQKVTAHHDAERTILTPQRQAQPPRDHSLTPQRVPEPPSNPGILGSQTRTQSSATDLFTTQKRTDRLSNASTTTQSTRVLTSSTQRQSIHQANRQEISSLRPVQPAAVTPRLVQPRPGFQGCDSNPQLCGPGRCVDLPGERYTCICTTGYQLNLQRTRCFDIDECRRTPSPCDNGYCENVPGSFRCVCFTGYELRGNTCIDINECKNDLQCPGQECVNTKGSFRCVPCRPGFELKNQQCQDIDECRTPSPCENGYCQNIPGSFRCRCFTGYELRSNTCLDINECKNDLQCPGQECVNTKGSFRCVPCRPGFELKNQQCQDIDECRRTPSPCDNGYCENVPGSFRCVCFTGYELRGNTCIDIDECRTPSPCDNGYCENVPGSFRCRCFTGYELQGNTCIDINECKNDLQCPGQECVNTKGSFRCVPCRPGFELKNQQCQDVDECQQNPSPCVNSQCENSPGSYQCVCFSGYELEGNSCVDVDECEDPSQCAGQECVNLKGSYRCIPCQQGYVIKNGRCTDVDECQSLQGCGPEGLCVNTAGSYHCDCQPGYRAAGLGHQCKDINECFEGEYCFPHGECMNTEGSYLCVCSEGFKSSNNLSSCIDVDECARPEACQDGSCVNTQGSFQCQCDVGFMTNPEQTTCLDKDECADSGGAICWPKRCENTIGSYYCVTICEPGYAVSHSGECMDINECVNETICGEHTFCQNLIGTYQCMCNQGYKATDNGKGCEDENECETIQGVCGTARCENMEGSFLCECPGENEEFDLRLRRCFSRPQSGRLPIPNGSSYSSSFSFWNPDPQVPIDSAPVSPPASLPGELRECYYNTQDQSTCRVLTRNSTYQECCCTVGEGWGLHCQYSPCPSPGSVAYQALCPSGRGYVTSESGVYSYRDVDECKLFDPEVCKRGLCVNNIPGYACYCPTGYYYHTILLECTDNDECEGEVACFGGTCVNTMGSFYCSCQPPLVLDYTQRTCVNLTGFTIDENLAICWGQVTELICQNPLLDRQVTFSECCCLYGYAWGLDCALCPSEDSDDFEVLCNALRPPGMRRAYSPGADRDLSRDEEYDMPYESYPERPAPGSDFTSPGYNPYISLRGRTSGYRGRPLGSYRPQESPYDRQTYASRGTERRPYLQTSDVVSEPVYEALPRPRSRGSTRSLPPRRQSAGYRDLGNEDGTVDETRLVESWMRFLPEEARSYPSYPSQPSGRAISERRYESYQSFSSDECGIVNGCENGRCIRISEGYTCDCYDGYYLDIASMSCIDINECEETDDPATLCVNGQCVNTDGSYRCICERGYVMYHEPNLCIPSRSRP
ncbi:latent-transforming growth factor beta-binding protein 4 isoform X43 [Brienomyrus brachyistius]|uniref:latent-transforming growth factor beta-binding protein 4 isoform X40 n=1 Tax=Brienomyrus brachyistius TaxID=42636 RepID=UPI0020B267B4|nr:latent-transforming growth factor beta-binding protein 4 isoform X40 [Brienomyrus brachyistius]XP_048837119.1 latent-transforming growth factor beta-binding protein 4 isoform X41 [Brienomyrus brachyistius]XP_048837121.1 latent-transforming growth factor beta-binding protein 4 isoform X43 [Brienomyrus brachyistius]